MWTSVDGVMIVSCVHCVYSSSARVGVYLSCVYSECVYSLQEESCKGADARGFSYSRSRGEGLVAAWNSRPWPRKAAYLTRVLVDGLPRVTQAWSEAVGTLPGSRL